jgi:ABC-type polysaccharide/polyol phosphate export permease
VLTGFRSAQRIHLPSFLWTLVRTDFKIRYHGSVSGLVWALLRPLSMFLVLQAVFSLIFATAPTYRLNLLIGLFVWDFFVEATKSGLSSLLSKGHLLTKIKLPTPLLVVASTSNALITLGIFIVTITVSLIVSGLRPSPVHLVLFVSYLVEFWLLIVGFSLASSVLFLKYRDLNQLWDLILQAGFFAAPIVYPLSILPLKFHIWLYLWPPTPVVQFSRSVLVDGIVPSLRAHVLLGAEAVVVLLIGAAIFRRYGGAELV